MGRRLLPICLHIYLFLAGVSLAILQHLPSFMQLSGRLPYKQRCSITLPAPNIALPSFGRVRDGSEQNGGMAGRTRWVVAAACEGHRKTFNPQEVKTRWTYLFIANFKVKRCTVQRKSNKSDVNLSIQLFCVVEVGFCFKHIRSPPPKHILLYVFSVFVVVAILEQNRTKSRGRGLKEWEENACGEDKQSAARK